jgi:drug/metabolite transporter (DMT)-like permease
MNKETVKKNGLVKRIFALHFIIMIYTLSTVVAKYASGEEFFSFGFFKFYGIEIFILFVYAILWQQIIKKFPITVAYANRAMALFWSIVWAILFFNESVTIKNVIGVVIVVIGTIIVNRNDDTK